MGAHNFTTRGTGRNVTEAYRDACREAEYEDGHDGYNGTISTTSGVREIPARELKGLGRKARVAIVDDLATFEPAELREALAGRGEEAKWLRKRTTPATRRVLERLVGRYTAEKWGACLAVEVPKPKGACVPRGHRVYIFAGWAAS